MQKRTVRSDFGEVSLREQGLIQARVLHGVEIDIEKARIYHGLVEHLSHGEPHCTVIDLSGITGITTQARKFLQEVSSEWGKTVAVGLITNSFTSRILANFFLSVNKPSYPIRVFTDALQAKQWAKEQYLHHLQRAA